MNVIDRLKVLKNIFPDVRDYYAILEALEAKASMIKQPAATAAAEAIRKAGLWTEDRKDTDGISLDVKTIRALMLAAQASVDLAKLPKVRAVAAKHTYPSKYPPGAHWTTDEAWAILDMLPPGMLDDDWRFLTAGRIAGALSRIADKGPK